MVNTNKKFIFFSSIVLVIFMTLFFSTTANGQITNQNQSVITTADFLIDWSTDTYIPSDYRGKALPTYGSKITLSATPLTSINENNYEFIWLIDLAKSPNNNKMSSADFIVTKREGGTHNVFLTIREIKTRKTVKETAFKIPISSSQVIVYKKTVSGFLSPLNNSLNIGNTINPGEQLNLITKPFNFNLIKNIRSLNYTWSLNSQKVDVSDTEPDKLSIDFSDNISSGYIYNLDFSVKNPQDEFQFIEKRYRIIIR